MSNNADDIFGDNAFSPTDEKLNSPGKIASAFEYLPSFHEIALNAALLTPAHFENRFVEEQLGRADIEFLAEKAVHDINYAKQYIIYLHLMIVRGVEADIPAYDNALKHYIDTFDDNEMEKKFASFLLAASLANNTTSQKLRGYAKNELDKMANDSSSDIRELMSEYKSNRIELRNPGKPGVSSASGWVGVKAQTPAHVHTPITAPVMKESAQVRQPITLTQKDINEEKNRIYSSFIKKVMSIIQFTKEDCKNNGEDFPDSFAKIEAKINKGTPEQILLELKKLSEPSSNPLTNLRKKITRTDASKTLFNAFSKIDGLIKSNNKEADRILDNYLDQIRPNRSPQVSPSGSPRIKQHE